MVQSRINRFITIALVFLQSLLITVVTLLTLNSALTSRIQNFPQDSLSFYLSGLDKSKSVEVLDFIEEEASTNRLFFIKEVANSDESGFNGIEISILGDVSSNSQTLNFEFLGQSIFTVDDLEKLLTSENQSDVLGYSQGSIDQISDLPKFIFGDNITISKLSYKLAESSEVNGNYKVVGLNYEEQESFLERLSNVTGISTDDLIVQQSGYYIDSSLRDTILLGTFITTALLLFSILVITVIKSMSDFGKLAMLGWSSKEFIQELFKTVMYTSLLSVPFSIILGLLLTSFSFVSLTFLSILCFLGILNILIVGIGIVASSFIVWKTKPVDAIKERFSKKSILILLIIAYLGISSLVTGISIYLDTPIANIKSSLNSSRIWSSYSDYKIISSMATGNDESSLRHESSTLSQDMYDWYKSVENSDGVYIVNTTYYSDDVLNYYEEGASLEPFWYFTLSPNYLNELGISISNDIIEKAKNGVRIYLVPNTWTNGQLDNLKSLIERNTLSGISEDDIQTEFVQNREFEFITYTPNSNYFTWSMNESQIETNAPVIYLATSSNMTYFEIDSLFVSGLENSYIKIKPNKTNSNYIQNDYLNQYNLEDNQVTFSSVQKYIDGEIQTMLQVLAFFGGFLLILIILLIIFLETVISVYKLSNFERIVVKRMLGYSIWQVYRLPLLLIVITSIIQLLFIFYYQSQIGILMLSIMLIIQLVLIGRFIKKRDVSDLLQHIRKT